MSESENTPGTLSDEDIRTVTPAGPTATTRDSDSTDPDSDGVDSSPPPPTDTDGVDTTDTDGVDTTDTYRLGQELGIPSSTESNPRIPAPSAVASVIRGDSKKSSGVRGPSIGVFEGDRGFDDLLSLDDVDRIVSSQGLRLPAFRLVKDGDSLPSGSYTKTTRTGSDAAIGVLDARVVFSEFGSGATKSCLPGHAPLLGASRSVLQTSSSHR